MTKVNRNPPAESISIGSDHFIEKMYYKGEWVGVHEWHKDKDGEWCVGWVPFSSSPIVTGEAWDVQSREPLTMSPSLLCRSCGSHGFIRNGTWVEA